MKSVQHQKLSARWESALILIQILRIGYWHSCIWLSVSGESEEHLWKHEEPHGPDAALWQPHLQKLQQGHVAQFVPRLRTHSGTFQNKSFFIKIKKTSDRCAWMVHFPVITPIRVSYVFKWSDKLRSLCFARVNDASALSHIPAILLRVHVRRAAAAPSPGLPLRRRLLPVQRQRLHPAQHASAFHQVRKSEAILDFKDTYFIDIQSCYTHCAAWATIYHYLTISFFNVYVPDAAVWWTG